MYTLRDILNRARWSEGDLHALVITVIHRGAPADQRAFSGSRIIAIGAAGVELSAEEPEGETAFVPYHRFLAIQRADAPLWDRQNGERQHERAEPSACHVLVEPPSFGAPSFGAPSFGALSFGALSPGAASSGAGPREIDDEEELPTFSVVLRNASAHEPLVLDGSAGEGGGQILRTSLTLSMLTGTPFVLERIRAGRAKPGLMRQHLTCLKAAAAICDASVEGATLGSTRLVFRPGAIRGGEYMFEIGSAGSAPLVVQTLALPLALAAHESRVTVRGGTHAQWAPIYPFLENAWLPMMRAAGADIRLALHAVGFYPAGGGEVLLSTSPVPALSPLHLPASSGEFTLSLEAIVAGLPEGIARRELSAAAEVLADERVTLRSGSVRSPGPGNALWLTARDRITGACNVFSAIGEQGVPAEDVGAAASAAFLAWRASGSSIEAYLADQVMLPIAVAGEGSFTCDAFSLHARTNLEVMHAFTGHRLRTWRTGERKFLVELQNSDSARSRCSIGQIPNSDAH